VAAKRFSPELDARFTALFATYGLSLSRLASSYSDSRVEREDLLQDIAMAVWQALPQFRGECSERTFIFRIAHNRGISHIAKRRVPEAPLDPDVEIADPGLDAATALVNRERGDRLVHAIRRLPIDYRQVLTLALEDLSYADIAEITGLSVTNVGARLTRARQLLRRALGEPS